MRVLDFLGTIGVDRETIGRISAMLEETGGILRESRPSGQTEGAFGASPAGRDLDAQTMTAHHHVVEALEEMMAGFRAFAGNVEKFGTDILGLDEDVQAQLLRGTRAAATYASDGDFHDNGIAPPASDGGGAGHGGDH
ncbi:hypothetical protein [Nocardioides pyridinolyticus]